MNGTIEPMLPDKPNGQFNEKRTTKKTGQILATLSVCLAAMAAGTTLSWSSPCLAELENVNSTHVPFHVTPSEASWIGSLVAIGALISALPSGYLAEKVGRKSMILFTTVPFATSWALIIQAKNVWYLYIARVLAGIGTGTTCVLVPMYISEITEDSVKGPLCSLFALFLCIGILLPFLVATFAHFILLSLILAIIPTLFVVTFVFMPETPLYLIKAGKESLAKEALIFLRDTKTDLSADLANMKKDLELSTNSTVSLIQIMKDKYYVRCLLASVILFSFQQLSGINAVIFYTVPIFEAAKSNLDPILASIIVASIQVIACVLLFFIIDKQGRKAYIIQSCVVCFFSLSGLGIYFHLTANNLTFSGLNLLPLISLMIYILSFSIGLGPVPWVMIGEFLAPEIFGTVCGISIAINWSAGFLVTKIFGSMMSILGPYITFYIFAALNGLCVLLVYWFVPETRGKTPQEVQLNWK